MDIALWIAQGIAAAIFLASGIAKSTMSKPRMIATGQTGVAPFPLPLIRVVAAAELAGSVGLIVPWASGVSPWLTPLAACGLIVIMVGAVFSHASLREYRQAFGVNVVLIALLLFITIGRFTF